MSQLNVGNIDRALSSFAGLVLVALAGFGRIGVWGYIGVILIAQRNDRDLPSVHPAGRTKHAALTTWRSGRQGPRMQLLIEAANWLGVASVVVIAGLIVVTVLPWLLKHPGPS